MHEYSLACSIAEICRDSAHKHGLVTIERVILAVGPQAAVQEDTLDFLFTEVAKAYGIGCPHLVFQHEPLQVKCGVCGETTVGELPTGGFREIWHNPEGVALPVRCPRCDSSKICFPEATRFDVSELEGTTRDDAAGD